MTAGRILRAAILTGALAVGGTMPSTAQTTGAGSQTSVPQQPRAQASERQMDAQTTAAQRP